MPKPLRTHRPTLAPSKRLKISNKYPQIFCQTFPTSNLACPIHRTSLILSDGWEGTTLATILILFAS
jgi:hypothetical protein